MLSCFSGVRDEVCSFALWAKTSTHQCKEWEILDFYAAIIQIRIKLSFIGRVHHKNPVLTDLGNLDYQTGQMQIIQTKKYAKPYYEINIYY